MPIDPQLQLADGRPRARKLGLPFAGRCGANNALTDVSGVEVGYTTLIAGGGERIVGEGPIRTGVTAILPRGRADASSAVWSAMFSLNGNGEMTGSHWINEVGQFGGPICITNTHSVGIAHHGILRWLARNSATKQSAYTWILPVVAETCDHHLNDMSGLHVTEENVIAAIESAGSGPIEEGNVGGGTGMICYEFKGGTGTASRVVEISGNTYTVAALVQANHGLRPWLTILGVPVGQVLYEHRIFAKEQGSIIVVVATDAPLLPIQLQRIARRISIGVGRTGTPSGDSSGDIFIVFSTTDVPSQTSAGRLPNIHYVPNELLDPVFLATVEATEEAIVNALVTAQSMVGADDNEVVAIDHDELRAVMRRYGRLSD